MSIPSQLKKISTFYLELPRNQINRLTVKPLKSVIVFADVILFYVILQDYKFVVTHIPGNRNCLSDLLSRL